LVSVGRAEVGSQKGYQAGLGNSTWETVETYLLAMTIKFKDPQVIRALETLTTDNVSLADAVRKHKNTDLEARDLLTFLGYLEPRDTDSGMTYQLLN